MIKACLLLVLFGAEPDDLVRMLGSRSPARRQHARTGLLKLGERAWPALEGAVAAADPEIAGSARRILRAWGWLPPELRGQVTESQRLGLFGADPKERLRAVLQLRKANVAVLRHLFAATPATFAVEAMSPRRTYFDLAPSIPFRLRNASLHPGWAPPTIGHDTATAWRPFGRAVVFPARKTARPASRRRFRTKRRIRLEQSSLVEQTERVLPGAYARRPRRQPFTVGGDQTVYRASATFALVNGERLVAVHNPLPFDVPVDCASLRLTLNLLPREASWGEETDGARARLDRVGAGRYRLRVDSQFVAHAPRDFGSAWYVVLDDEGEVIAHGPVDGGDAKPRTYTNRDLMFVPRPPDAAEKSFVLRDLPAGAARLVAGIQLTRGRYPGGYTAVSNALSLR